MGQKSHPVGLRLGYVKPWSSRWYADRDYAKILHEDIRVRKTVKSKLYHAGVSYVVSSRRRHTRFDCDWSSDVCSSDLQGKEATVALLETGSFVGESCV